jgi:hypothetical protein
MRGALRCRQWYGTTQKIDRPHDWETARIFVYIGDVVAIGLATHMMPLRRFVPSVMEKKNIGRRRFNVRK